MRTTLLLFFMTLTQMGYSQLNYVGLKEKLNSYNNYELKPQLKIINDYLYVPTGAGIYKKHLSTLNDTLWNVFAFENVPIRDFVKNENKVLAITPKTKDSLLLYSNDNGASYTNFTHNHFFDFEHHNSLHRIVQNKQNPNSILVLHSHYGLSKSVNFGLHWNNLNAVAGGYQERFVNFHPKDSLSIYYSGETEAFSSYTQVSNDGGLSWNINDAIDNNCTHFLAFHPTDQHLILAGQEGRISKSEDKGTTWSTSYHFNDYLYVYKILFDAVNPNIIYAAGAYNNPDNNFVVIYKSSDKGDTWQVIFQEPLSDGGGVIDIEQHQNFLLLLTFNKGVYVLNLENASTQADAVHQELQIYPNPAQSTLYFTTENKIEHIQISDISGKLVKNFDTTYLSTNALDLANIAAGVYWITFKFDHKKTTKKLIIK